MDANLARGFITIQNSGGKLLWGVVWKPHCHVIFCHDASDFNTAQKLCFLHWKMEMAFVVFIQEFIGELWLVKHNVLVGGNCSDLIDTQLHTHGSRDEANSRHNVTQTYITDVSKQLMTVMRHPKNSQPYNMKQIQVTQLLTSIRINVINWLLTTFYTVSV